MRCVYKYELTIEDTTFVEMPEGAKPLHVAEQGKSLCMWCLVDPDAALERRQFRIMGTGHKTDLPAGRLERGYLGTALMMYSSLVFHVFEITD